MDIKLSAFILVKNEEQYIKFAIESIKDAVDEIIIIDDESADRTVEIARSYTDRIFSRPLNNDFAQQCNFAVDQCLHDWILMLDADEMISRPLAPGLKEICKNAEGAEVDVVGIPRLNFIDFKLKESPGYKGLDYQYRLFKKYCKFSRRVHCEITGWKARIELQLIDGHFILHEKDTQKFVDRNIFYKQLEAIGG